MADPCPAAELIDTPDGPAAVCKIESSVHALRAGHGQDAPLSIVVQGESPVSFARCSGCRRQPTNDELVSGRASLDGDGRVVDSERHELCPTWRKAKANRSATPIGEQ